MPLDFRAALEQLNVGGSCGGMRCLASGFLRACLALLLLQAAGASTQPPFHTNGTYHAPNVTKSNCTTDVPLRLWAFPSWMHYYEWRWSISPECARRQPIQPCVYSNETWACLPKLVVIGPIKGGTTGLRAKLTATRLFYTKLRKGHYVEGHLWDKDLPANGTLFSNTELAQYWADEYAPRKISWYDLVDEEGYAKKLALEVTPSYLMNLVASDVQRMLEVNPDVHFLMLARDPADAFLDSQEASICRLGVAPNTTCGTLGCDSWIPMYPALSPEGPERNSCRPEEIPCKGFAEALGKMFEEGLRRVRRLDDPVLGYLRLAPDDDSISSTAMHDRWRYAYFLHQEWMRVVPEPQLHVLQTKELLEDPRRALLTIRLFLKAQFRIPSVNATRIKPERHLACGCPDADNNIRSMQAVVERCRLRDAVRCAYLHHNKLFAELVSETFKERRRGVRTFDWSGNLTHGMCQELGFFSDSPDLYYNKHTLDSKDIDTTHEDSTDSNITAKFNVDSPQ